MLVIYKDYLECIVTLSSETALPIKGFI